MSDDVKVPPLLLLVLPLVMVVVVVIPTVCIEDDIIAVSRSRMAWLSGDI